MIKNDTELFDLLLNEPNKDIKITVGKRILLLKDNGEFTLDSKLIATDHDLYLALRELLFRDPAFVSEMVELRARVKELEQRCECD